MITLNLTESRRKDRDISSIPFLMNSINAVFKLGDLRNVAWHVITESFGGFPEASKVMFIDQDGKSAEITLHPNTRFLYKEDVMMMNKIMNHFGLLPGGKIIGINWGIGEAVNHARKKYPFPYIECADGKDIVF